MNEVIEQLEAAIAASYEEMIGLGWIPRAAVVPNRYSESFIDLVLTRLTVFSKLSFGEATKLTFEIQQYLADSA
jgi:hypothetical protein